MSIIHPLPISVAPGSGKVLKLVGITHKLTRAQTGGSYYLFEFEFGPGGGNNLHVHRHEDEVVYVLKGDIEIRLASQRLHVEKGGVAYLPKNIPHALYNPAKIPLKVLAAAIPGGMEEYFDELEAALAIGPLDDEMHNNISLKYGIEWLE
ncbi:MAG TPA: cupin domain-containing protein [Anaerolineales bacterium]|nr:cupin domain-containing protein [Anaerolineales bacterium]